MEPPWTPSEPACYRSGTAILTDRGERPIESLAAGDVVITASRRALRIRWIGRRSFSASFIAGNRAVLPIRIRAGALGPNIPSRDLYVSPRHALYIADVLVPAACLINGSSILQVPVESDLLYVHVELDSHDILLAEGAPAESYLDLGTRGMFHNHHEGASVSTGLVTGAAPAYARRVTAGPDLRAIQILVTAFAGAMHARQAGELLGHVDEADARHVSGWAWQADYPDEPAILKVCVGGRDVGTVIADGWRPDVRDNGFGGGQCGFRLAWPSAAAPFQPCSVEVRRLSDDAELSGSPRVIQPLRHRPRMVKESQE